MKKNISLSLSLSLLVMLTVKGVAQNNFPSPVGIGTSSPQNLLHLFSSSGDNKGLRIENTGTGATDNAVVHLLNNTLNCTIFTTTTAHPTLPSTVGFYTDAPNGFTITNGNSPLFRVMTTGAAAGNVGVGVAAPLYNLHINNSSGSGTVAIESPSNALADLIFRKGGVEKWQLYSPVNSNDLRLYDGSDRITFRQGGNLGIGTITPTVKLHVQSGSGGGMGFPYETGLLEKSGDNKLGVYSSTPSPINTAGASLTLGFTNYQNINGKYPGFEVQNGVFGPAVSENKLLFTSLERQSDGVVTGSNTAMAITGSGNVGVGTNNPETKFDVNGIARARQLDIRNDGTGGKIVLYSENGGDYNQLYANPGNGFHITLKSWKYLDIQSSSGEEYVFNPFQDIAWRLYNSNTSGAMTLWGYQGKGLFITKDVVSGKVGFRTVFSDGNFKHEFVNGNVSIGTSDAQSTLSVNGNINARKVKVTQTGWADYVFENDYKLPTLKEVEDFIKQHQHLPGIVSAKQVEENGIDLGENQAALLKKIEEMTLYMIEMKKEIQEHKAKTEQQQKEIKALKKLLCYISAN